MNNSFRNKIHEQSKENLSDDRHKKSDRTLIVFNRKTPLYFYFFEQVRYITGSIYILIETPSSRNLPIYSNICIPISSHPNTNYRPKKRKKNPPTVYLTTIILIMGLLSLEGSFNFT